MNLAILMPALNEAGSIPATLERIPHGLAQQLIVVDNGSTDGTADCARRTAAQHRHEAVVVVSEPRRGYGQACLTGLAQLQANIEAVGFLDADGADDAAVLAPMLALIATGEADLVLSTRQLGEARENLSPPQRFGNWLAAALIHWLWGYWYTDMGPMRIIRRDALARLQLTDTTWGWNVEMQIKAIEQRLKIREIPVSYGRRIAGKSKISGSVRGTCRAGVKILSTIGRLWWQDRRSGRCMRQARAPGTEPEAAPLRRPPEDGKSTGR